MMQIGDLASRAGVTPRTIRYYEEIGIIAPDERTAGGFRLYSENQLRRLNIVQGLKMLGFDLDRIRELFAIKADCKTGGMLAGELVNHIRDQQTEIDNKLQYYAEMKERNAKAIEVLGECLMLCGQCVRKGLSQLRDLSTARVDSGFDRMFHLPSMSQTRGGRG